MNTDQRETKYLKQTQVADALGLHTNTVRKLIRDGQLRAVVLPGLRNVVVPAEALAEYEARAVQAGAVAPICLPDL